MFPLRRPAREKGTEANQPLALAVVGGLTSPIVLSLFLVPVMFLFFAKRATESDEETHPAPPVREVHA
ncbi:MAG: efflux RND transporter permease subunit [Polyangiaceae bacterium]